MNAIYFAHVAGTPTYGLLSVSTVGSMFVPASTEADLIARGGGIIPLLPDGHIDFTKAKDITLPV